VLTLEERKASLQDCNYDNSSVLIVGGGTNGVEIASELRAERVGIVSRGPRLLPGLPHAASRAAEEYMR
jgi:NADH dehydrogenase FAD-containing subunit